MTTITDEEHRMTIKELLDMYPCWIQGAQTRIVISTTGIFEVLTYSSGKNMNYLISLYYGYNEEIAVNAFLKNERDV